VGKQFGDNLIELHKNESGGKGETTLEEHVHIGDGDSLILSVIGETTLSYIYLILYDMHDNRG
jgi:hypothetical protein